MIDYQVPTITRDKDNPKLFAIDKSKQQYNVSKHFVLQRILLNSYEYLQILHCLYLLQNQDPGSCHSLIHSANGYCGILGGAGNGGSWSNIKVVGGKIGLDLRGYTVPTPVMEGITLINQKKSANIVDSEFVFNNTANTADSKKQ